MTRTPGATAGERAINKAMALGIEPRRITLSQWAVASASTNVEYIQTELGGGKVSCTCKAGERGIPCWHASAVKMAMVEEWLYAREHGGKAA